MKTRGFTLIELLAVIVVLAIIALIATPIVMNVIKNASAGAAERSADNYVKAVDTLIATNKLDGIPIVDGTYTIGTDGNLEFGKVEVSGTKPVGGTIVVKDGQVFKESSSINFKDHTVTFEDGKAEASESAGESVTKLCTLKNGEAHAVGSEYTCDPGDGARTFYVLENLEGSENISLIMDKNIDNTTMAWCLSGYSNTCGADGAKEALEQKTSMWKNTQIISIDLPTYDQIYNVNNSASLSSTLWLYDNLDNDNATEIPRSYWTYTPNASNSYSAWVVYHSGVVGNDDASNKYNVGVRPVITISKSSL